MHFPLSARIAWRYLCSKKSHSAVGAISAVSICGIAVATAAIICVLSVFNGFKELIVERVDTLTPDVMVTPAKGKIFPNADSLATILRTLPEVKTVTPTILENALALYDGRETPVSIKGVDFDEYSKVTAVNSLIIDYQKPDSANLLPVSTLSVGAALRLAAHPGNRVLLFTPRREGRVNLSNPAASFLQDSVLVTGVYRSNQSEYDENRLLVDIDLARDLLQYDTEASAIELKAADGVTDEQLAVAVSTRLNPSSPATQKPYVVKDRLRQQEMNFRMISIEKWVTFLLLFFILIIASFNIVSSLSMLVIEKENSMATLKALGMSRLRISSVFRWESVFVTLVGGVSGIILGLVLSLLQQQFGLIKLQGDPDTLIIRAYPVVVDPTDILITLIPLIAIGFLAAVITGSFARSRCR